MSQDDVQSTRRHGRGWHEGRPTGNCNLNLWLFYFYSWPLNTHLFKSVFLGSPFISWQLLMQSVSISGVTEESWTEANMKLLDQFILDTFIPSVVVYERKSRGLQVDYNTPITVLYKNKMCCLFMSLICMYCIRSSGAFFLRLCGIYQSLFVAMLCDINICSNTSVWLWQSSCMELSLKFNWL